MQHGFFGGINWDAMMSRSVATPYKPQLSDPTDTSHFSKDQTEIPILSPNTEKEDKKKESVDISGLYEETDEFSPFYFSPQEERRMLLKGTAKSQDKALY